MAFGLNQFNQLQKLAENGVEVKVLGNYQFAVGGFYKSGEVVVDFVNMSITARYDEVDKFEEDDDLLEVLAKVNYKWWDRSQWRFDGWKDPNEVWARYYKRYSIA
jgi:hypothetical protein